MLIETLESRRMLSATITFHVDGNGVLDIQGTSGADVIDVSELHGVVTVVANQDVEHPLFFGTVSKVKIDCQGGDDQVSYFGDSLTANIFLKDGSDYLQIGMSGTGKAIVSCGNGDDIVIATGDVTISGGNGNDTLLTDGAGTVDGGHGTNIVV